MSSSIFAARAALFSLLDAAVAVDCQVTFGAPGAYEEQEVVAILGVEDAGEEPVVLGANRHEEVYSIEVGIKVYDPASDSAPAVDTRMGVLYNAVRDVLNANITLSATVRTAWVTTPTLTGPLPAEGGGWVSFLRVLILCKQRIT